MPEIRGGRGTQPAPPHTKRRRLFVLVGVTIWAASVMLAAAGAAHARPGTPESGPEPRSSPTAVENARAGGVEPEVEPVRPRSTPRARPVEDEPAAPKSPRPETVSEPAAPPAGEPAQDEKEPVAEDLPAVPAPTSTRAPDAAVTATAVPTREGTVEASALLGPGTVVPEEGCRGDCGFDMSAQVTERTYDSASGTWLLELVADVFAPLDCYTTPSCRVRLVTEGVPLAGPVPPLVCAPGWSPLDGGCVRTTGQAFGEGFSVTVRTSPGAPQSFSIPWVFEWVHMGTALAIGMAENPVFLAAPATLSGSCPESVLPASTLTCALTVHVPGGTAGPIPLWVINGGDGGDGPGLLTGTGLSTDAPGWTCAGVICSIPAVEPGTTAVFTTTSAVSPAAHGGVAQIFGATDSLGSGPPFGYGIVVPVLTPADPDVQLALVAPATVEAGGVLTVEVMFTNESPTPAPQPFQVVGILAELDDVSVHTAGPEGWSCGPSAEAARPGWTVLECRSESPLAAGASVTVSIHGTVPAGFDRSAPIPVIAFSMWSDGNVQPHHYASALVAVTAAPGPDPDPDPGSASVAALARPVAAVSASLLPVTGGGAAALVLSLGLGLCATGTTLVRRRR